MKVLFISLFVFFAVSCGEQTKKDIIILKKSTPLSDQEIKKQGNQIKKKRHLFYRKGKIRYCKIRKDWFPE